MRRLALLVFIFSLSLAIPAQAGSHPDCLARIREAILTHDEIHADPALPSSLDLALSRGKAEEYFTLYSDFWHETFDRERMERLVRKLRAAEPVTAQEQSDLHLMRAALKQLRFAFVAFDGDHETPRAINRLAIASGNLQDAVKNQRFDLVDSQGTRVIELLSEDRAARIEGEISGFSPARRGSFRSWVDGQAEELTRGLARAKMTPRRFHELRKVIGRFLAVYDAIQVLRPTAKSEATRRVLSTLNGRMGAEHDKFIAGRLNHSLDYVKDRIQMPRDIRELLEQVAARLRSEN